MPRLSARIRTLALALVLTAPLAACAQQLTAETEHVKGTDFSQYQTYRWITDDLVLIQSGTGNENIRNVENEKRIRAAVERELEAKGLKKATGDEAQLVFAFTVGTKVRYQIQGGVTGLDLVAGEAASVTRGTLSLYAFDPASNVQVWSGWTTKDLEPGEDPDAVINAAVSVVMNEFPPKS
ncbi:DUF4136 domain-containing protein [Enhygromyxa salina]|uniref:DUF4136 domain-containing protein n=1 Tax=Enhygromyxa salina TaxID=215803 RepID=A0A2S9YKI8_9BACT|nr:DUF4136 domain-containing protein [Enhygromyxa salina]PRQ05594.1 hypothetical protein ENSA7_44840 [Enhygromyxa salina]